MASVVKISHKVAAELGLNSLFQSCLDTKLLIAQRFIRLFAYGSSTLVLVLYLRALNISESNIGFFMTLTLVGDVLISFILTLFADGLGRRRILALGATLMVASGIIFTLCGNYWILLIAAVIGVISPSGNEIGPFRAIEESTLAYLTPAVNRGDIFAWYTLIGSAGAACGTIVTGFAVRYLEQQPGWDDARAYRVIFSVYSALGLVKLIMACCLSSRVEAEVDSTRDGSERSPLLHNNNATSAEPGKPDSRSRTIPTLRKETQVVLVKLCLIFTLDQFASGLVPSSWVIYFFHNKFSLDTGYLGSLFFTTGLISSASTLVAASLAKRIGLVQTMVFTHLPSAISLSLIPIPSELPYAMLFLILRSCTQSMDAAPRSAFLAAVVPPNERTTVMGIINVVKTATQSLGPIATGYLAQAKRFWIAFVIAGALKATYDLSMLAMFRRHKTYDEQPGASTVPGQQSSNNPEQREEIETDSSDDDTV